MKFEIRYLKKAIRQKHRLVYTIADNVVNIDVLAAYGHYGDK